MFTKAELFTIQRGLEVAAEQYDKDAKQSAEADPLGMKGRIPAQFQRQALEARTLAERVSLSL